MEETFWKFWYGDDTIVLTYSVMMTIAGLMPFFGKDTDKVPEPHPGKETGNVSEPLPGKDADNAPETTPGKTADNVAKPNWRKWTGKIGHLKNVCWRRGRALQERASLPERGRRFFH